MRIIVIGGGAAGFFGAITAAETFPDAKICIWEKSNKLLSKVKVSGGGRCNVTHDSKSIADLLGNYPRGNRDLKPVFQQFNHKDVVQWFEPRGVKLKTEADGRMFPISDDSQTIIDCFIKEAARFNINIELQKNVTIIRKTDIGFELETDEKKIYKADRILIATGGHPQKNSYQIVNQLNINLIDPIPSLFTFNDKTARFKDLMGVSVDNALVKIGSTNFSQSGPLLITHWGLSGPAVIKLSAWAAVHLHDVGYKFKVLVSWIGAINETQLRADIQEYRNANGKKTVIKHPLFLLPTRLWERLCMDSEIDTSKIWAELPAKNLNKLMELLIRCPFDIQGKTTFKEEFVTCGGIDLNEIDLKTMQSKQIPGLFFAGEVINVDGVTGGFNFQAAWSTAWVAGKNIGREN
ncbi:MAG: NAD(P)/FAD-dependent oxidoreductase [Bacteroidota bacterium]|nr:NAD(P)/FAD-dependent oxidoreductase [Bacteroidota bacterium]